MTSTSQSKSTTEIIVSERTAFLEITDDGNGRKLQATDTQRLAQFRSESVEARVDTGDGSWTHEPEHGNTPEEASDGPHQLQKPVPKALPPPDDN